MKSPCEINDDHMGLPLIMIYSTIQVAHQITIELDQLGFARPLTSETMLTASKNAPKGQVPSYVANYYMAKGSATDAHKQHWATTCSILFFTPPESLRHIRLPPTTQHIAPSKRLTAHQGQDRSNPRTTFSQHPSTQATRPRRPMYIQIAQQPEDLLSRSRHTLLMYVQHVTDATGVSPTPAGPPGSCPLHLLHLSNLRFMIGMPNRRTNVLYSTSLECLDAKANLQRRKTIVFDKISEMCRSQSMSSVHVIVALDSRR